MGAENAYSASAPSPLEEEAPAARAPLQSPPASRKASLLAQVAHYTLSADINIGGKYYLDRLRESVGKKVTKDLLTTPEAVQEELTKKVGELADQYQRAQHQKRKRQQQEGRPSEDGSPPPLCALDKPALIEQVENYEPTIALTPEYAARLKGWVKNEIEKGHITQGKAVQKALETQQHVFAKIHKRVQQLAQERREESNKERPHSGHRSQAPTEKELKTQQHVFAKIHKGGQQLAQERREESNKERPHSRHRSQSPTEKDAVVSIPTILLEPKTVLLAHVNACEIPDNAAHTRLLRAYAVREIERGKLPTSKAVQNFLERQLQVYSAQLPPVLPLAWVGDAPLLDFLSPEERKMPPAPLGFPWEGTPSLVGRNIGVPFLGAAPAAFVSSENSFLEQTVPPPPAPL